MNKRIFFTTFNKRNDNLIPVWVIGNFITHGGFKYVGKKVESVYECDFIVYFRLRRNGVKPSDPGTYPGEFDFDTDLADTILQLGKKIIVFDYMEYPSSDYTERYLYEYDILGYKIEGVFLRKMNDYFNTTNTLIKYFLKFRDKGLIFCYFKRELSKFLEINNIGFPVYPCDFFLGDRYKSLDFHSEEEFNDRLIDTMHTWGPTSLDRSLLHDSILSRLDKFGRVTTSTKQLLHSINTNKNIKHIVSYNHREQEKLDYTKYLPACKTVIDMYGVGMKCFRNLESSCYSVAFKQDPSALLRAYPWEDGVDCIFLPNKKDNRLDVEAAVDIIYEYTRGEKQHKVFEMLKASQNTANKYRIKPYTYNYILPKIQSLID